MTCCFCNDSCRDHYNSSYLWGKQNKENRKIFKAISLQTCSQLFTKLINTPLIRDVKCRCGVSNGIPECWHHFPVLVVTSWVFPPLSSLSIALIPRATKSRSLQIKATHPLCCYDKINLSLTYFWHQELDSESIKLKDNRTCSSKNVISNLNTHLYIWCHPLGVNQEISQNFFILYLKSEICHNK